MIKQVQFFGRTELGVHCQSLFGSSGTFEKVAGAPPFADWETGDDLRKFLRGITPEMRKKNAYVLVNALGAGEYFGSNINADYFPWNALAHEGDDYGYKTFLKAHAFQHHKNKDPTRAFGIPVLSVLNPRMKRVELVIELNREKAREEGADGIINRIDAGEFPDVSMGCKVPYDVCSICDHRSKTRADYCEHMMPPADMRSVYGPNKILPDGRKIYVVNTLPRFFDISFVFIGADKTAKVMAKLASKGNQVCLGDVCALPRLSSEVAEIVDPLGNPITENHWMVRETKQAMQKTAGLCGPCGRSCSDCSERDCCHETKLASAFQVRKTAGRKLAEILKDVPAGSFALKKLPELEKSEPDLPCEMLDEMSKLPLPGLFSGLTGAGVVLKPKEFQRVVLKRTGHDDLADALDESNKVFRPSQSMDQVSIANDMLQHVKEILPLLGPYIHSRTGFGEPLRIRVVMIQTSGKKTLPTPDPIEHPLLDKLSAAYNGYRREVMKKLSQAIETVQSDSKLREMVLGDSLIKSFTKSASDARATSLDSVSYFMSAHLPDRSLLTKAATVDAIAASNKLLDEEIGREV